MLYVSDVLEYLWTLAPEAGKESWDNVGLLVGRSHNKVTNILTTLDITLPVIQEAQRLGAQLIVSHHPVIWDTHKFVTDQVIQQERVLRLIECGLAAICMHTNLDEAEDGVDDTLTETLGLTPEAHLSEGKIGHISMLDAPMPMQDFLTRVQEKLHANGLRYFDSGKPVHRIATGCGSCGEYLKDAVQAGCDTFLTGDVKYNVFLDAQDYGINLIDAGHFATENPIVEKLAEKLRRAFPETKVFISEVMYQPDRYFPGKNSLNS